MRIAKAFTISLLVILFAGCQSEAGRTERRWHLQYKQVLIGMSPAEVVEIVGPHTLTETTPRLQSLRAVDKNKLAGIHVFFVDGVACRKVYLKKGRECWDEGYVINTLWPGSELNDDIHLSL
jgi:hypothetical protein